MLANKIVVIVVIQSGPEHLLIIYIIFFQLISGNVQPDSLLSVFLLVLQTCITMDKADKMHDRPQAPKNKKTKKTKVYSREEEGKTILKWHQHTSSVC